MATLVNGIEGVQVVPPKAQHMHRHRQPACVWVALMVLVVVSDFSMNALRVVGVLNSINFLSLFCKVQIG